MRVSCHNHKNCARKSSPVVQHLLTMAAKIKESPSSKLSPGDRLARKRAAARLRQQRCRARKRQAVCEQRRQDHEVARENATQDSRVDVVREISTFSLPHASDMLPSPPSEPIYNCVSFESQRSYEEVQRIHQASPPRDTMEHSYTVTVAPSSKPVRQPVLSSAAAENQPDESLVPEEEAAIAAMLSLKTGTKPTDPASQAPTCSEKEELVGPRTGMARVAPRSAKYRYYRSWEPQGPTSRHYDYFTYGRPYYNMVAPPRGPPPPHAPPHYRYYPAYPKRYIRYGYDS